MQQEVAHDEGVEQQADADCRAELGDGGGGRRGDPRSVARGDGQYAAAGVADPVVVVPVRWGLVTRRKSQGDGGRGRPMAEYRHRAIVY